MATRQDSSDRFVTHSLGRPTPRSDHDGAVRVVLVADQEIIAEGLRAMLARHPDEAQLVGRVRAPEELLATAAQFGADVVLVDLASLTGIDCKECPFRVVVFTDDADERRVFEALRLGASGYLLTSLTGAQLVDHLVRARNGEVVVDPTLATRIAMRAAHEGDGQVWPGRQLGLSQRESQVLGLLAEGLSNRLIASELIVGEETVKTHLRNIYRKLEVKDRAQAVAFALRRGIVH
jgi:DNA-binding NarL/FixJ family response regulator